MLAGQSPLPVALEPHPSPSAPTCPAPTGSSADADDIAAGAASTGDATVQPLFEDQGHLGLVADELWPGAVMSTRARPLDTLAAQQHQQQHRPREAEHEQARQHGMQADSLASQQQQGVQQAGPKSTQQLLLQQQQAEAEGGVDSDDDSEWEGYDVTEDPRDEAWNALDPK